MSKQLQFARIMSLTASIVLALVFALPILAQKPVSVSSPSAKSNIRLLSLGKTVESQIRGGETHFFQFDVKAGQYARAEVEQKNIDVVVSLFAPGGKLVVEMDDKDSRLWREAVSCLLETDGAYRVEIKGYGTIDATGS